MNSLNRLIIQTNNRKKIFDLIKLANDLLLTISLSAEVNSFNRLIIHTNKRKKMFDFIELTSDLLPTISLSVSQWSVAYLSVSVTQ